MKTLSRPTLLSIAAIAVLLSHSSDAAAPNIVMIISDDQAWTDYGFMGHEHIQTPRLDQLAKESVVFSRGYVPDSLCRPSLATMITGLYPHQHLIVGNDPPFPASVSRLPPRQRRSSPEYMKARVAYLDHITAVPTLPRILAEHGYASHQSGKWWEGSYQRGGFTHGMTHGDRRRGGRHGDLGLKIGREGMAPVHDFIDQCHEKSQPFFLWYAPFLPHTPHNPPQRLLDKYREKTDSLPIAKYWAMCEWFDETCGQLLDHLEKRGLTENTLVLYVCDNGWINDRDASRYAPRSKRSQYEGGIRTPIMVRWPGRLQPRFDKTTLASSIDLAPTVLAAAKLPISEEWPGLNLMDQDALSKRKSIHGEILEHDIQHMTDPVPSLRYRWIIREQWKLVVPYAKRLPDQSPELFDVVADPFEKMNVADQHPHVVEKLRAELDQWWTPVEAAEAVKQQQGLKPRG